MLAAAARLLLLSVQHLQPTASRCHALCPRWTAGGDGNDEIWGEDGKDTIYAGAGDDEAHGGVGKDSVDGEERLQALHPVVPLCCLPVLTPSAGPLCCRPLTVLLSIPNLPGQSSLPLMCSISLALNCGPPY